MPVSKFNSSNFWWNPAAVQCVLVILFCGDVCSTTTYKKYKQKSTKTQAKWSTIFVWHCTCMCYWQCSVAKWTNIFVWPYARESDSMEWFLCIRVALSQVLKVICIFVGLICVNSLCDWLRKLHHFSSIEKKNQNQYCDLLAHIFGSPVLSVGCMELVLYSDWFIELFTSLVIG